MYVDIVRTLTNVRHVLDWKKNLTNVRHVLDSIKNLIYLGMLETLGCKCTTENGIMKVSKGALVIMKACRSDSLYILQRSTVTGSVVVSSSSLSNSGITKLWHMRLGHMGENGLNMLSKQGLLCGQSTESLEFYEYCIFEK